MPSTAKHEKREKLNMKALAKPLQIESECGSPKYLLGVQAILREKATIEKTVPLTEDSSLERGRSPRKEIYIPRPAAEGRHQPLVKPSLSLSTSRERVPTKQGFQTPRRLQDSSPAKIHRTTDLSHTLDELPAKLLNQTMTEQMHQRGASLSDEESPDSPDTGAKRLDDSLPKDASGPQFQTIPRKDAEASEASLKEDSESPLLRQSLALPTETWKQQANTILSMFDQTKKPSNTVGVNTPR